MKKYLTKEGFEKIKSELEYLKNVKRKEIAERLRHAIGFGDLSENAAYQEAKEAQAFMEGRILELEEMLRNVKVIQEKNHTGVAGLGSEVWLEKDGEEEKFKIVGANEADPLGGKISSESPLGKTLLGKRVGEAISINTPNGKTKYKILRIE